MKNRIDDEFALPNDLSWHLIVDGNKKGAAAFHGFVKEECILEREK